MLEIKKELIILANTFDRGKILREGISVVIAGKPNAGKSSLLNELIGNTKAIVTDIPGTTRDTIEEYINIKGIPVKIIDTAGIRSTTDIVEKIGVEKAHQAILEADLTIIVLDAYTGILNEDIDVLKCVGEGKKILLINKTDLVNREKINEIREQIKDNIIIEASVKKDIGITDLEESIYQLFIKGTIHENNEVLLTNARHKILVDGAIQDIEQAINAFDLGMPLDMITIDIKNSAESIGQITGESIDEAIMHNIFSRFCIGK